MASIQIRDTQTDPQFLQGENGQRYLYTMRLMMDLLMEKMNQGMRGHMPGAQVSPTVLPFIGDDRVMVQGPAEPDDSFAARLSKAFEAWGRAGSRYAILQQIQAFVQQTDEAGPQLPLLAIVSVNGSIAIWDTIYTTTPYGAAPAHVNEPVNWDWNGRDQRWWAYLILYPPPVATGLAGTAATIANASGVTAGLGHTVAGVWVPNMASLPLTKPFLHLQGLSGLSADDAGKVLTLSNAATSANNGGWYIVAVTSATTCTIANPHGVAADANNGALHWSIAGYDVLPPGPAFDTPGFSFGDTTWSWGLNVPHEYVDSIRALLQTWKKADTYYPVMIVARDGSDGRAGSMFSPNSATNAGNPDDQWGDPGKLVAGVWVPSRVTQSALDAICTGTGRYVDCSVPNVT